MVMRHWYHSNDIHQDITTWTAYCVSVSMNTEDVTGKGCARTGLVLALVALVSVHHWCQVAKIDLQYDLWHVMLAQYLNKSSLASAFQERFVYMFVCMCKIVRQEPAERGHQITDICPPTLLLLHID